MTLQVLVLLLGKNMLFENIIPLSYQEEILNILGSNMFPWYWNEDMLIYDKHVKEKEKLSTFTHILYNNHAINSEHFNIAKPLIYFIEEKVKLKIKSIIRIQANLLTPINITEDALNNSIHTDTGEFEKDYLTKYKNYYSFLYYVNNADGNTYIYSKDKKNIVAQYSPKQGNGIWFKSTEWHRATPPTNFKKRIVINFMFEIENKED